MILIIQYQSSDYLVCLAIVSHQILTFVLAVTDHYEDSMESTASKEERIKNRWFDSQGLCVVIQLSVCL